MADRTCRECGAVYQPTAAQQRKRDYICLACRRAYNASWRAERRASGLAASGTKTWAPEKREAWKAHYRSRPDVHRRKAELMRSYGSRPEIRIRREARRITRTAIQRGQLKRQPCERCGHIPAQAHHDDYGQPLIVRWLCRACHTAFHHAKAEGGTR